MANKRSGGRSYGQIRAYMDGITERHTREILRDRARTILVVRPVNPDRLTERKRILQKAGLLSFLEKGIPYPVLLPGNKHGIATAITAEGFVVVKGWAHPFNPKVVHADKPPRT